MAHSQLVAASTAGISSGSTTSSSSSSSSHLFRAVASLKDEYSYEEDDLIGSGAFSSVFKAKKKTACHSSAAPAAGGVAAGSHTTADHRSATAAASGHAPPLLSHLDDSVAFLAGGSTTSSVQAAPSSSNSTSSSSEQLFALKVIAKKKLEKDVQLKEVEREVSVLLHLKHSGCTHFCEALQTRDEFCIVMRFVDDCLDIARYMKGELHGAPMGELHVALVAYQLLATVDYLHSTFRLLHRDVKLENMLLSPLGGVAAAATLTGGMAKDPQGGSPVTAALLSAVPTCSGGVSAGSAAAGDNKRPEHPHPHHHHQYADAATLGGPTVAGSMAATVPHPLLASQGMSPDILIDDAIARRAKMTLLDFGLSRWIGRPAGWTSLAWASSSSNPAFVASSSSGRAQSPIPTGGLPVSPVTPSLMGSFPLVGMPDGVQPSQQPVLQLTPCGTDRYLPREMLRHMVEADGSRKPTAIPDAKKIDAFAVGVVVYLMLSAHFPFNGKTKAALAAQQVTNPPRCNAPHWHAISDAAKSFVQGMLKCDVQERFSIEQALSHEWIKTVAEPLATKLGLRPTAAASSTLSPLPVSSAVVLGGMACNKHHDGGLLFPQRASPPSLDHSLPAMDGAAPGPLLVPTGRAMSRSSSSNDSFSGVAGQSPRGGGSGRGGGRGGSPVAAGGVGSFLADLDEALGSDAAKEGSSPLSASSSTGGSIGAFQLQHAGALPDDHHGSNSAVPKTDDDNGNNKPAAFVGSSSADKKKKEKDDEVSSQQQPQHGFGATPPLSIAAKSEKSRNDSSPSSFSASAVSLVTAAAKSSGKP